MDMATRIATKHGSRRPRSEENPKRFGSLKGFGENLDKKRVKVSSNRAVAPKLSQLPHGQAQISFTSGPISHATSSASSGVHASMFDKAATTKKPGVHLQKSILDFLGNGSATKRLPARPAAPLDRS